MSNIFKVNNKDTRMMPVTSIVNFEHISLFILLLLLLNLVWEDIVLDNKFVFCNCEKYVVLWAGKVCWATHFHLYSPKTRLWKEKFSRQPFKNISRTLPCELNLTWWGEIYQNKSQTVVIKLEKSWTFWCNTPCQSFLQRINKAYIKSIDPRYSFFLSSGFPMYSFNRGTWCTCLKLG